jgi:hypothetical protein
LFGKGRWCEFTIDCGETERWSWSWESPGWCWLQSTIEGIEIFFNYLKWQVLITLGK